MQDVSTFPVSPWLLVAFFLLFMAVLFLITKYYWQRDQQKEAYIQDLIRAQSSLQQHFKEQDETIRSLRTQCAQHYRRQFQDIADGIEHTLLTKNTTKANAFYQEKMSNAIAFFSSPETSKEREEFINEKTDGLLRNLRKDCPTINETDINLLCYMAMGFDATLISLITGMSTGSYYTRKSRIKERILSEDNPRKEYYRTWFF